MDVLVTGGTGFIGQYLCGELHERGHDVTALARTPQEHREEGITVAIGDVTAYDSIADAFEGQDAVVNLVALSPLFKPKGGNEMHEKVHLGGTENCLRAAEEHDIGRFVQMSALGATVTGPTAYLRAKGRAEQAVRESDLEWTIFRPSVVFGDGDEFVGFTRKVTPPYLSPLPGGGKTRFQPIHVEDLVPLLADAAEKEKHAGETYEIGGPEVLTLAEVAKLARAEWGQPVNVLPVPMALAGLGMTVGGMIPRFPFGKDQYRSLQKDNVTNANDIDAFGYAEDDLLTLAEYLGVDG